MKPSVPITSKAFRYVPAANTDIGKTFARVRREQKQVAINRAEAEEKVRPIRKAKP